MTYKVGDTVLGTINNVRDNGVFVSLQDDQFGFLPKSMMPSFVENGCIAKQKGDKILVTVLKITDGPFLLSDKASFPIELEKLKKQEQAQEFDNEYECGQVFEAEVTEVGNRQIHIRVGNVDGIINKEETYWNEVNSHDDLVYKGEVISAVYLGLSDSNQLLFSLKYLTEKPYADELYDLSLNDLLKYVGHRDNLFIGQAKQYGKNTFIENLYSDGNTQKGKLLIDPVYGYNLRAVVNSQEIRDGDFYRVKLRLLGKALRKERNQLFQFGVNEVEKSSDPYKKDIELTFDKNTSPATNVTAAHLLAEVGQNMYSSKDRMFFELVQNADDAAAQIGVLIRVFTEGNYLTLLHNGYSFDKSDFEAITSAANGTKNANENSTGYKGIGFKSVFTDSEQVYIKTGGYRFKFDKHDERFSKFDLFYFTVNRLTTPEAQQDFLDRFSSEKRKFKGVDDIPWQLEPIWVDEFPKELGAAFAESNVSIALKLGENKIVGENGYQKAIDEIINSPKFMLFLRNTKRIDFNGRSVSKETKDNKIYLKNSFNNNRVEVFERVDFKANISNDIFESKNIEIRIKIDKYSNEAKFVDLHNQVFENIPPKIAINDTTTISFAIPVSDGHGINPLVKYPEISLFAFLPTLVKDFRFPFYINANFILDPPRQRILGDNPWNFYLMQEIASRMVDWCAELSVRGEKNALNILVANYFEETSPDTRQLAEYFNTEYKSSLESKSFILNQSGNLAKQEETILDRTGLAQILGEDLFCAIINTEKQFPSNKIDSSILYKKIFTLIECVECDDIADLLVDNDKLNEWYISSPEEHKERFHRWLTDNEEYCNEVLGSLPIFQFGDVLKSPKELQNDSNYLITTECIEPIKDIISKLGFVCTDDLFDENHPLWDYIELQEDKEIFDKLNQPHNIQLSSDEKIRLIKAFEQFNGIGEAKIKSTRFFTNTEGVIMPLGEMLAYRDNCPYWIRPYMLCKEEYSEELNDYLIPEEDEFAEVVWSHIDSIDVPVTDLFNQYQWSDGQYTRALIDKYGTTKELLSIIEASDKQTQTYFLRKIDKIELCDNKTYKDDSIEFRILQLALSVYEDVATEFSDKIFYNNDCITKFTVKNEVLCKYVIEGKERTAKFSLAKLLPHYCNLSDSIERIKSLFESKRDIDKFFNATAKSKIGIFNELNELLNIPPAYDQWTPNTGNAVQYLFSVYYRREDKKWFNTYVPKVELAVETEIFIREMMDFLFENRIDIKQSPFTYHISNLVINKYFVNDFVFESECLLPSIEKWADDDKKKMYLTENGVKGAEHISISFRHSFKEDNPVDYIDQLSDSEIVAGVKFFATVAERERPFEGINQISILNSIKNRKGCGIKETFDIERLVAESKEWISEEYTEWRKEHFPQIFLYPNQMPIRLDYDDEPLARYNDKDYWYDKEKQQLFINNKKPIDDLLFEIAKENKSDFDLNDYQILCRDGKITISKDDLDRKDKTINDLISENEKLKERLSQYEVSGNIDTNISTAMLSRVQSEYNKNVITRPGLSQEEQITAHIEAERVIKDKLEQDGYDCSGWVLNDNANLDNDTKWHSINQVEKLIKDPEGRYVNLVVKSAKGGYIFLSATDFEFLTSDSDNVLMVWDGKHVHSVTGEQIFNKNSDVNLIFDAEYTPKHYYAALSRVFQFVKRTTFAVKNPVYNAYQEVKSFGMDAKTEGVQKLFDDNDI